jgi:hypothetical protein
VEEDKNKHGGKTKQQTLFYGPPNNSNGTALQVNKVEG